MKKILPLFVLLCLMPLMAVTVGCDAQGTAGCGDTDTPVVDPPVVEPVVLDRTHQGWQNPNCSACHTQDSHNAGLDPFECVDCHGDNGAPIAHNRNTNCRCHSNTTNHPSASFPTESCQACHS